MTVIDRIGLGIDATTNDLYLSADGSLAVVTNALAVGQHVRQRLMTFEGEWFLDTTAGVTWLSEVFGKKYDPALAESLTKAEIMDTDGVTEITDFSVRFFQERRNLDIYNVAVMTEYDEKAKV